MRVSQYASFLPCVLLVFAGRSVPARASVAPSLENGALVTTVSADFVAPRGVAFDPKDHSIVVADAGTSRIERIAADGSVSVIAGTSSGFRDGPQAQAMFAAPKAVAVGADGAIYVADTGNRRVRRIAGGVVTTLQGDVSLMNPVDLTVADDGTVYVADTGTGIRVFAAGGVTTLSAAGTNAVEHLALWNGAPRSLFFVTPAGTGRIDLASGTVVQAPVGGIDYAPGSIVALDATQFVAALPNYQALYFSTADPKYPWWRRVAGNPGNDATVAGDFADGPPESARFSSPSALALDDRGNVLVADTANHRIRRVPALDLRWDSGTQPLDPNPRAYRIAFVSNSVAFYDTMWGDSIGGVLERRLSADAARFRVPRPLEIRSQWLGNSIEAQDEYFENSVVHGSFDCVIWAMDYNNFNADFRDWPYYEPVFDAPFRASKEASIARGIAALAKSGIPVVLTDVPFGFEVPPLENAGFREAYSLTASLEDADVLRAPGEGYAFDENMEAVLGSLQVPYVPSYERILAYERGAHAPLYGPVGYHFSPAGTEFFGNLVADYLETADPCRLSHPSGASR